MRGIVQDLRFGFRLLIANPGFAIIAVLTLALGIASTATVFAWIDGLLLHPYHGAAPGRLAVLETTRSTAPNGGNQISWLDYVEYRDHMTSIASVLAYDDAAFTIGEGRGARLVWGENVSPNFFQTVGVSAQVGRVFGPAETGDAAGGPRIAVISDRLWRDYFNSDPTIAGRSIRINREPFVITGVAAPHFHGLSPVMYRDLWIPLTARSDTRLFRDRDNRGLYTVARLRERFSLQQADAEAAMIGARLSREYPNEDRTIRAHVVAPWAEHNGVNEYLVKPLRALAVIASLVLLLVCANAANLLLTRSVARQRELGVRLALGAAKSRIARQLFTETLLLSASAAVAAYPLTLWMSGLLSGMVPDIGLPIIHDVEFGPRNFAFAAAAAILAAIFAGIAPVLFSFRTGIVETLKEGGRSRTSGVASSRARALLAAVEVALAVVAMIGAGLFLRSFQNARSIHPGFSTDHILFGRFFIQSTGFSRPEIRDFARRLKDRLDSSPAFAGSGYSDFTPLSSTAGPYEGARPDGYVPAPGESMDVSRAVVSPGHFGVLSIPIVRGREFNAADTATSERVIIVNQTFARRYFGSTEAVGRFVETGGKRARVIGVAADIKYYSPAEVARPFFYSSMNQRFNDTDEVGFYVRTRMDPTEAIPEFRRIVAEVDPAAMGFHAVPLAEYTQVAMFGYRLAASLTAGLGAMCLIIAALGLYSVMSYAVTSRTQEIGIRIALGAMPGEVIRMVLREAMFLVAAGLTAGTIVAAASARLADGMLVELKSFDPVTIGTAVGILILAALVATWVPAYRASHVDPISALRH